MKILRIKENPFRKWKVKNLPNDAEYRQDDVNGNPIYYSEVKNCYYVVVK